MTMTYDTLVSQIILTFERSDDPFVTLIPNFIEQAHLRIARESIALEMVSYVKSNLVSGNNLLTKPTNWLRPLSFKITVNSSLPTQYQIVEWRSYDFCRAYFPSDGTISGQTATPSTFSPIPLFYSDYGREYLLLSPTPAVSYPFELSFYGVVPTLTSNIQTNFLTQYTPNVLLYATFLEISRFLKVDERIPVWQSAYDQALEGLNKVNFLAKEDRQTDRQRD